MAVTEDEGQRRPPAPRSGALAALTQAALALPIVLIAARAQAAQVGEMGITLLGYKERGLMKVTEPVLWGHALIADVWEVQASAAVDIVTGASPQLVSNVSGHPVQSVTGASINDRRKTWDTKVGRHFGDVTLSASTTRSDEEDYHSKAYGLEAVWDLDQKRTTLTAAYGRANDRVGSSIDPSLDQPRHTNEFLLGVTQILTPLSQVQAALTVARGSGWYNDPYKLTVTVYTDGTPPALVPDTRPDHRNTVSLLARYRRHFPGTEGTLQADYRYFGDDWGIRAHTLEVGWEQGLGERWSLRPALRYYTQEAADFYGAVIPESRPAVFSSDQRLGTFGGLTPSLRLTYRAQSGWRIEGTAGYVQDAASLHLGGGGSEAFSTLRAVYGIVTVSHSF